MPLFIGRLSVSQDEIILDVGSGSGEFWSAFWPFNWKPRVIGLDINLPRNTEAFLGFIVADACALPFKDASVDAIFSNSVLEHVRGYERQQKMVTEIQRVSRKVFIQVPAKSFPLEPHFYVPFFPFIPLGIQTWLHRRFQLGWFAPEPDELKARIDCDQIRLLTRKELKLLFPTAGIHAERLGGLVKSFIVSGETGHEG